MIQLIIKEVIREGPDKINKKTGKPIKTKQEKRENIRFKSYGKIAQKYGLKWKRRKYDEWIEDLVRKDVKKTFG